jgi:hypothetical protein
MAGPSIAYGACSTISPSHSTAGTFRPSGVSVVVSQKVRPSRWSAFPKP